MSEHPDNDGDGTLLLLMFFVFFPLIILVAIFRAADQTK